MHSTLQLNDTQHSLGLLFSCHLFCTSHNHLSLSICLPPLASLSSTHLLTISTDTFPTTIFRYLLSLGHVHRATSATNQLTNQLSRYVFNFFLLTPNLSHFGTIRSACHHGHCSALSTLFVVPRSALTQSVSHYSASHSCGAQLVTQLCSSIVPPNCG